MIGLDTNVLLRYFVRDDEAAYRAASDLLGDLTTDNPGFITQVTMAELYWVLSRSYRFDRSSCLAVVQSLVRTETLEFDDGEGVVRALHLAEAGADFADALIQGAMEQFGAHETVTFDRSAARRLGWRLLAS